MATGNGYYNDSLGRYQAKTTVTWETYLGDSSGNDWDAWQLWDSNGVSIGVPVVPELPLEFTTDVIDYGSKQLLNPLVTITASHPATITIYYGDTVDSAGGDIDSPSSVTIEPSTSSIDAINARYFQFKISVDNAEDSAGFSVDDITFVMPYIANIDIDLSQETVTRTLKDINSASLSGSTGIRQLDNLTGIGTVNSIICQAHVPVPKYVADNYVTSGYITSDSPSTPIIYIDKSTTPPTLNIYDIDTFGHRTPVDVTFDALATGLKQIESDGAGNIVETE